VLRRHAGRHGVSAQRPQSQRESALLCDSRGPGGVKPRSEEAAGLPRSAGLGHVALGGGVLSLDTVRVSIGIAAGARTIFIGPHEVRRRAAGDTPE
jgi:hypothetical protein